MIDTETKTRLEAADPKSSVLFKPYLRGQDMDRWEAVWAGLWMIAMKSSANHMWPWTGVADPEAVFRQMYPALFAHFDQYRSQLVNRQDQGEHWWELRSCAYWDQFDAPKIMYQEIQFHSSFAFVERPTLANNKVFFLPTADLFLLAVLTSPVMWWHNWRYLPHMKDEALTPAGFLMEELPIPKPTDKARKHVETLVKELIDLKGGRTDGIRVMLDWLRTEIGIEKVSNKLGELIGLTVEEMVAEIKKALPKKTGLSAAQLQRIKQEYATTVVPLQANARRADQLERGVSDLVNVTFGLTSTEVKLMWATAPPRMPFSRGE